VTLTTRFAPSPTGPLHLGHAYSAILAHDMARDAGGTFLLRIEDIDRGRSRPEWEARIFDDLHWLGLAWPEPVMRQSERLPTYRAALERLWQKDLLYVCRCSRRDIAEAASAPQEGAPLLGPDGIVYPGTCRGTWFQPPPGSPLPENEVLRLDIRAAAGMALDHRMDAGGGLALLSWREAGNAMPRGLIERHYEFFPAQVGDVVLARRQMGTTYHLSVVVDDAAQGITHVVRGADLAEATPIHVLLQRLLGLPTPI
jgi:glutamyl-Q tRNA(Asp) synthetase